MRTLETEETKVSDLPDPTAVPRDNALLKYRAHAAEVAVLTIVQQLQVMLAQAEAFVRQLQEVNKQFPLQDETVEAARGLQLAALREQFPGLRDKSDEELINLMRAPNVPPSNAT